VEDRAACESGAITGHSVSGNKTDLVASWSMADALRTDGHGWRRLTQNDPLIGELRLLCRDEMTLIEQRTAPVCQLRALLREYHPTTLEAFDDWMQPSALRFSEQFPTPQKLAAAG